MNIKELIEALHKYPEDAVVLHTDDHHQIAKVKLTPAFNTDGKVTYVYIGPSEYYTTTEDYNRFRAGLPRL